MNRLVLLAGVAIMAALPSMTYASADEHAADRVTNEVDSFRLLGGANGWHALDRDSLIVWVTPSKAYLLELRSASPDLRFANGIGLTSTMGKVSAKFDDVVVEGWRYPIKSIYALDRAEAKALIAGKAHVS